MGNIALKIAILLEGRTQRDVSVEARIPETRLSDLIRGRAKPRPDEVTRLVEVLKRPASTLFGEQAV